MMNFNTCNICNIFSNKDICDNCYNKNNLEISKKCNFCNNDFTFINNTYTCINCGIEDNDRINVLEENNDHSEYNEGNVRCFIKGNYRLNRIHISLTTVYKYDRLKIIKNNIYNISRLLNLNYDFFNLKVYNEYKELYLNKKIVSRGKINTLILLTLFLKVYYNEYNKYPSNIFDTLYQLNIDTKSYDYFYKNYNEILDFQFYIPSHFLEIYNFLKYQKNIVDFDFMNLFNIYSDKIKNTDKNKKNFKKIILFDLLFSFFPDIILDIRSYLKINKKYLKKYNLF